MTARSSRNWISDKVGARPLHKTSSNIQHTLGKLQTPTIGVWSEIVTRCLLFDEAMFRIFGDIHHCFNQRDDILLGGKDETEHREVLKTVLKRARNHGITFSRGKCQFGMEQIQFFGHVFTKDGLKLSPDKVRAVKECGVSENKEAVRSFLGMAGYLDNFIKNYAAIAAPLYQLTRKEPNSTGVSKKRSIQKDPRQHRK